MPSLIDVWINNDLLSNTVTARESRLRRRARHLGLCVSKSRRRNRWGQPIGYFVTDPGCNVLLSDEYGMNLDELEIWLNKD